MEAQFVGAWRVHALYELDHATYSEWEGCNQYICEAKFDYPPTHCQLVAVFRQYGFRRNSLARTLCTPATPIYQTGSAAPALADDGPINCLLNGTTHHKIRLMSGTPI